MNLKILKSISFTAILIILISFSISASAITKVKKANSKPYKITITGNVKKIRIGNAKKKSTALLTKSGKIFIIKKKKNSLKSYIGKYVKIKGKLTYSGKSRIGNIDITSIIKKIEITGTVKAVKINFYMQGSGYVIETNDAKKYLLGSCKFANYKDFVDKKVIISGFLEKTIEGSGLILDTTSIDELITISGVISPYDGYSIALNGYSVAYITDDTGSKFIIWTYSTDRSIKLSNWNNKKVEITGILDKLKKSIHVVSIKEAVNPS